ncbi:MAG: 23S rRNA (guanosine(2251)-2'-O)-methyltransferase RlmB [Synechococcus sp.]|nr:23S rRNA (guanosine(2251)-2'-O)-methyltransferase RlmB [Synechococcus sp.]
MWKEFQRDNKKTVNYMVKEFEMKKKASEYARTTLSKTGVICPVKMNNYKFSDDIFRKMSVTPEGKNHGMVLYLDWSGSMHKHMKPTIDQLLNLVMFCRQVNIPYRVYAFSDRFDRGARSDRTDRGGRPAPRYGRPPSDANREPEAESLTPPEHNDLVWGLHASQAILESERPIHRIWCTPELRFRSRFLQLLREAKSSGVLVEEVTWARLAQLSGGAVHQGIVLQTAAAQTHDLETLIDSCAGLGEAPLLMAVDGLTDPHNLGAIVRSAEALGAHGLVLPQRRSAGLTGSVAKVAAGALEHLPVARVVNLNRSLERLKDAGYRVVGLAEEGSATLAEADLDGPLVVVTGSEGQGLSMLTRRHCDQLVRIPLRGVTPSLNASVATALLLYEVARRNWMGALKGTDPAPRLQRLQLQGQQPAAVPAEAPAEAAPAAELPAALDGDIRL